MWQSYSSVQKQMGPKNVISILKEKIKISGVLSAEDYYQNYS